MDWITGVQRALRIAAGHEREVRRRTQIGGDRRLRTVQHVIADQTGEGGKIDLFELSGQFVLFVTIQFVPIAEQVFLPGGAESVRKFRRDVHGVCGLRLYLLPVKGLRSFAPLS